MTSLLDKKSWVIGGIFLILITSFSLLSINPAGNIIEQDTVKIGIAAPLSGSLANFGEWMRKGTELAKDEINSKGGINGKPIELVYEDSRCDNQATSNAINKLVKIDQVMGIVGPFCGGPHQVTASILEQENRIVAITPATNLGKLGNNFFCSQTLAALEAEILADFAHESLGLKKIGILYFNNEWGVIQKNAFKQRLESLGGKIIGEESFTLEVTDFRSILTKFKANSPDGIVIFASMVGNPVNQIKELGLDVQILGVVSFENPINLKVAGKNLEGSFYTFRAFRDETQFTAKYEEKYGEPPEIFGANSYDALMIISDALSFCEIQNSDVDCVREFIISLRDYSGVSGLITFDRETWDVRKPIIIKTVQDGQFIPYKE